MHRFLFAAACCVALAGCAAQNEAPMPIPQTPASQPSYIGASADALRVALGAPAFTRKDGRDELWRYDAAQCKAFFFLYPEDGGLRVRHVETVPRGATRAADPGCLSALRARVSQPIS